jgi:hypothetical protein
MPHAEPYRHIQIKELHPTFGAEVLGVDFSKEVPDEVFGDILVAIAKVTWPDRSQFTPTDIQNFSVESLYSAAPDLMTIVMLRLRRSLENWMMRSRISIWVARIDSNTTSSLMFQT